MKEGLPVRPQTFSVRIPGQATTALVCKGMALPIFRGFEVNTSLPVGWGWALYQMMSWGVPIGSRDPYTFLDTIETPIQITVRCKYIPPS